ncbi:uncharacterized protein [Anabrus simplex]|uniref:uncharacterized protein n=1 Tax=Anabrus simplex TaxID=316456 RepID=UPI0035A37FFA
MKCDTTLVLPQIFTDTNEHRAKAYFNVCLNSISPKSMSLGIHVGTKKSGRNSATWPKMKKIVASEPEDPDRYHPRPQTATLERPRILNIALLGKIDMSLTRKGLLTISNLCLTPIQKPDPRDAKRNGSSIQNGRGGKTRKYNLTRKVVSDTESSRTSKGQSKKLSDKRDDRWEDEDSSVSDVPRSKRTSKSNSPKVPAVVKQLAKDKRSPVPVNNNNNSDVEDNSKSCSRPVIIKKGRGVKKVDEVFGGPKTALDVPAPCTTCGRPEQPERLHSHPAPSGSRPSTMRGDSTEVASPKNTNRSALVKSSVRKPVPMKFRSGKSNRKAAEEEVKVAAETPRVKSATDKMPDVKSPQPAKVTGGRSGPRVVVCYLCGREFGTASLPLHEPHCLQRWQRENSQLPTHLQRPLPQKPEKPLSMEEWNKFAWEASQSILVPCNNCGRTFNPDRLEVHQRSCRPGARRVNFPNQRATSDGTPCNSVKSGEAQDRPASGSSSKGVKYPPTVYCYICGRKFGTASIGIHEPQCLEKWRIENSKLPVDKQRPEPIKPSGQSCTTTTPTPPAPSQPPSAPPSAAKGPRQRAVHCYLCGRQFGTASINIHEKQCLKKWRMENEKLPPNKRMPEPEKPDIVYTDTGEIDYEGTFEAIWQSHLDQLVPCSHCGRTFNPDRLEVHERSCKGPKR